MEENSDQYKNLIFRQNHIPHPGSLLSNTRPRTEYQNMCIQRRQLRWRTRTLTCGRNESKTDFCKNSRGLMRKGENINQEGERVTKVLRGLTPVGQGLIPKVTSFVAGLSQEPINRSLHLPYKLWESTLSRFKLFIELISAETLSRPIGNNKSEPTYARAPISEEIFDIKQWRKAWRNYWIH